MFCNQCGKMIPEGSRFCNHCGAAVTARGADIADEQVIFTVRPTLLFVVVWYVIAAAVVIATAALMALLHSHRPDTITEGATYVAILVVALAIFAIPIYKHILRQREIYTLTNHKLETSYGLVAKTVRNIPLRNIQDVTVTATAWQRLMGLGDILIQSASEAGSIKLSRIRHPERYADMILNQLRRRY